MRGDDEVRRFDAAAGRRRLDARRTPRRAWLVVALLALLAGLSAGGGVASADGPSRAIGASPAASLDSGPYHACAVMSDGAPRCWGSNSGGLSTVPADIGPVVAVSAGKYHTCAVSVDGAPVCWGSDTYGQTTVPAGIGAVVAVSAGTFHSCAVRADGVPVCWGDDTDGQATVPPGIGTVVAISAGTDHSCAVRADGTPVCWGDARFGRTTPPVNAGAVIAISAGELHSCAVRGDGTPVCWGDDGDGRSTPPAGVGRVVAISAGEYHSCAVRVDGAPVCWGDDAFGKATPPADVGAVVAISTGLYHSCAIRADGALVCWGRLAPPPDGSGAARRLSLSAGGSHSCAAKADGAPVCWGSPLNGRSTPPAGAGPVLAFSLGDFHSCALRGGGTPVCWGSDAFGQARPPAGVGPVVAIGAGELHSCAVKADGTPVCWGNDGDSRSTPPAGVGPVVAVSAGMYHSCAVRAGGTPICWGNDVYDQRTPPAGVGRVVAISAGAVHTCAVRADGTPVCWGSDGHEQMTVPAGVGRVVAISAGEYHSCAVKADGTPVCWGSDGLGQSTVPAGVGRVVAISAGSFHTCAVRGDGRAVCWGLNSQGQRGASPEPPGPAPEAGAEGAAYAHQLTSERGTPEAGLAVTDGALPPGVTLGGDGSLSGMPTEPGTYPVTLTASNGVFADASATFSLEIAADATPPAVTVAPPVAPAGRDGWLNAADMEATGGQATVRVEAIDPLGVGDVACTVGGASVTVGGQTGAGTPGDPRTGTVAVAADGAHEVACVATDEAFTPNTGAADPARAATVVRIDTTPPEIACPAPAPRFVQGGTGARVTAAVGDSGSGASAESVSAAARTDAPGIHAVTLAAADRAGNGTTRACSFAVDAPREPEPPTPNPPEPPAPNPPEPPAPNPPEPPARAPRARLALALGEVAIVRDGAVGVRCRSFGTPIRACRVVVRAKVRAGARDVTRTVGRGRATSRGGRALTVRVRLNRLGRRMLADRLGGVRTVVEATATPTARSAAGAGVARRVRSLMLPARRSIAPPGPLFDADGATLNAAGRRLLTTLAGRLRNVGRVRCEGHVAAVFPGPTPFAELLALRRAQAACDQLRERGVWAPMQATSRGKLEPLAPNDTEASRAVNRRVSITVTHVAAAPRR